MLNTRRHNPILHSRLTAFSTTADWNGLLALLRRLSVADFRTAGLLLSEQILPALSVADFWNCFGAIVPSHPKAYLMTFMKAAVSGGAFHHTDNEVLQDFLLYKASAIDKRKTLEALLPHLDDAAKAYKLLILCTEDSPRERISLLIKVCTPVSYYMLFREAQRIDNEADLRAYCLLLMKRGERISFNLACIMGQYFALRDLPGTFSLRLQPYEFGRLNESYENFKSVLLK